MKKVFIYGIVCAGLFFSTCHSSESHKGQHVQKSDSFYIIGKITGQDTGIVSLIHQQSEVMDSVKLNHGYFTFKGIADTPEYCLLGIYKEGSPNNFKGFFLENGKLSMLIKKDSLEDALISGTATQDEYSQFERLTEKNINERLAETGKLYHAAREKKDKKGMDSLDKVYDDLDKEKKQIIVDYVKAHPASYVSAFDIIQNFSYNPDPDQLASLYKTLDTSIQSGYYGRDINELLKMAKLTAIGQPAPAFTAPDVNGKPISLASFKGKYVLVDFWASWCGPCRQENPAVVKAFHQFHPKGFDILGVSLDESKTDWQDAIKKDGLNWAQVSDLKGGKNEVAVQYGIQGIPMNYLLNKDGRIIAKGLRGDDLIKKLQELLH